MSKVIMTKARNYVAMSPLLRKGGVHQRSKTGVRAIKKHELQSDIMDWQDAIEEERSLTIDPQASPEGSLIALFIHQDHGSLLSFS